MLKTISIIILAAIIMCIFSCKSPKEVVKDEALIIAESGVSGYKIVLPDKPTKYETQAADVLQKYIQEATGAKLNIQSDRTKATDLELIIGNCKRSEIDFLKRAGHQPDESDFLIKSVKQKVVFLGDERKSVRHAAYSFLEKYLGIRYFDASEVVVPKKEKFSLSEIYLKESPVFKFRDNFYRPTYDRGYTDFHKLDHVIRREEWSDFWGHTFFKILPPKEHFAVHPEYYSLVKNKRINNGQICTSNPEVVRKSIAFLKQKIAKDGKHKIYSISQNDTGNYCECDRCNRINDQAGTPMGAILTYVNSIADAFPETTFSTLAYTYSRKPPKNMRPRKNVQILLAPIEVNQSRPIETDPSAADFRKDFENWGKLTKNLMIWDYVIAYKHLMAPFPNLRVLQPNFKYFAKNRANAIFVQGNPKVGGEFAELRSYLISKFIWNPNLDFEKMKDEFVQNFYGKAAPQINEYIKTMHDALETSRGELGIYDSPNNAAQTFLTPTLLKKYTELFNAAEKAVSRNKVHLERVKTARLPLIYAKLELGKQNIAGSKKALSVSPRSDKSQISAEYKQQLKKFKVDAEKSGVEFLTEYGTSPNEYYNTTISKLENTKMVKRTLDAEMKISTLTKPSPKYNGGDVNALINGLKGDRLRHETNWLGYEGNNMEVIVDFQKEKSLGKIEIDFLKNIGFGIADPRKVSFFVSKNGKKYEPIRSVVRTETDHISGVYIVTFRSIQKRKIQARYLKVVAENIEKLQDWHPKAGQKAWMFADEIVVE